MMLLMVPLMLCYDATRYDATRRQYICCRHQRDARRTSLLSPPSPLAARRCAAFITLMPLQMLPPSLRRRYFALFICFFSLPFSLMLYFRLFTPLLPPLCPLFALIDIAQRQRKICCLCFAITYIGNGALPICNNVARDARRKELRA